MTRFILSHRRAPGAGARGLASGRRALSSALDRLRSNVEVLRQSASVDGTTPRRVMIETDSDHATEIARAYASEVIVEPEILHFPVPGVRGLTAPIDFTRISMRGVQPETAGGDGVLGATLLGGGVPLANAEALLYVRGSDQLERVFETRSDADGAVRFAYPTFFRPSVLVVVPAGGFWGLSVRGPRDGLVVDCPPLPADGPGAWWHEALGVQRHSKTRGRGIRVGVIDTGTGPNACLDHVGDVGSFVEGLFDPDGGADSAAHGSHVAGIIGARPVADGQYAGIAPGANLFAARVFPPEGGANQMDIADALDRLSEGDSVDLVNLSLGAPVGSAIEQDAIRDALDRGTLCVCAAGNSAGPVSYPAAFPETVAVAALGSEGREPAGTPSAGRLPAEPGLFGANGLYLANFSCFGPEITCAAPGVGIVSTVPATEGDDAPYAAFDGTSMASPLACGALAAILSVSSAYKALPRDATRAAFARRLLRERCTSIGLLPIHEGQGVPLV